MKISLITVSSIYLLIVIQKSSVRGSVSHSAVGRMLMKIFPVSASKESTADLGEIETIQCKYGKSQLIEVPNTGGSGYQLWYIIKFEIPWKKGHYTKKDIFSCDFKYKVKKGFKLNESNSNVKITSNVHPSDGWKSFRVRTPVVTTNVTIQYRLECYTNYYSYGCQTHCREDAHTSCDKNGVKKTCVPRDDDGGHYTCDSNKDKQCLDGWTGPPKCDRREILTCLQKSFTDNTGTAQLPIREYYMVKVLNYMNGRYSGQCKHAPCRSKFLIRFRSEGTLVSNVETREFEHTGAMTRFGNSLSPSKHSHVSNPFHFTAKIENGRIDYEIVVQISVFSSIKLKETFKGFFYLEAKDTWLYISPTGTPYEKTLSYLSFKVKRTCCKDWYHSRCLKYCKSDSKTEQYRYCNSNGDVVCKPGRSGDNCDKLECPSGSHTTRCYNVRKEIKAKLGEWKAEKKREQMKKKKEEEEKAEREKLEPDKEKSVEKDLNHWYRSFYHAYD